MTSTSIHDPIITAPPSTPSSPLDHLHRHHHDKRHFYLCGDETLSWEQEWYTASFFTSARASYDRAASSGPVQPPMGVYQSVPACAAILSSQSLDASSSGVSSISNSSLSLTGGQVVTTNSASTFTSNGRTFTSTSPITTTIPLLTSSSTATDATATLSGPIPSSTVTAPASVVTESSSINSCAGDWDWQAWGVVAGLGSGVIFGGLLWILWAVLRRKLPGIYSPRTWAVPPESRPTKWTILIFLLPFLHPPQASTEGASSLTVLFAGLKLAGLISLLAIAAILPLLLAGTPCLSETSPLNFQGGRLGTLTDLSLLRLLNALDPSPDSSATSDTLLRMFAARSLSSTISPAITNARVRLIVILVILAVLGCGGGLFVIARTYAGLVRQKNDLDKKVCRKMDMVYIRSMDAPGWKNRSEEGVRKLLKEYMGQMKVDDQEKEIDFVGVFAIPDTTDLKAKVEEREKVLMALEVAEAKYLSSFNLTHTPSNGGVLEPVGWNITEPQTQSSHNSSPIRPTPPDDFLAPKRFYKIPTASHPESHERLNVPLSLHLQQDGGEPSDSRFREINRDSAMYGGRFDVGQRIKMDPSGQWVPDPSPKSEEPSPLGITPESTHEGALDDGEVQRIGEARSSASPSGIPMIEEPISPSERPRMPTRSSHRVSVAKEREGASSQSPLAIHYAAIRESRARFKELNNEIDILQKQNFAEIATDKADIIGWVVVGKGVRWLPHAELIEGYTREDILWGNAVHLRNEAKFWLKVTLLGVMLGVVMIPFLGLTVGTAPGFAHYLGLLKPFAESDGFGSGLVEGLIPAVMLGLVILIIVHFTEVFSRDVRCVSRSRQKSLAHKAVSYLLLFVIVSWTLLVNSLEFAVQGFATNVQEARVVGDGAIFSTWFVFVLLLNLAFILPALYLLQVPSLFRYYKNRKKAITPRQKYRLLSPPSYSPAVGMMPCLLTVFYASTLLFIFPLLAIPILLLLYLSFVANRYMVEHVFVDTSSGYPGILLSLWTVRRFGWTLAIQPALYGLILMSRNEWTLGGIGVGVSVITLMLSEGLTVLRYHDKRRRDLDGGTRKALDDLSNSMRNPKSTSRNLGGSNSVADVNGNENENEQIRRSRQSDLSLLNRVQALLPGYSRLPIDCPIPLAIDKIDDMVYTERASYLKPEFRNRYHDHDQDENISGMENGYRYRYQYFTENANYTKGLIYPPEMVVPTPVIWLPRDEGGLGENEVVELGRYHRLIAIVDPPLPLPDTENGHNPRKLDGKREGKGKGKGKGKEKEVGRPSGRDEAEVSSPLLNR
ncbi:uncharacterized protein I303_101667 [Kwoniella dejecticola CBS 10117]|uniref:CSC1/OSCA1-like 7TM region domain-containing protein n=1 Tax=Kwoniella dejecticola CBS 10117 TaxID=1296121 RepID=A0A1A6AD45_9TREE|nr:uncharacterized protein I303_02197 [Kwoniella dejecticola CBS 10117]OBR87981.1 hypothetical protein I303_02197 [Kwoniella dejecticola CBS 10117]